jgi:hypothetical protein
MHKHTEKTCPKCGQQLRFPKDVGGMLMACPSCGQKFYSDFKLGTGRGKGPRTLLAQVFAMPDTLFQRILRYFTSRR